MPSASQATSETTGLVDPSDHPTRPENRDLDHMHKSDFPQKSIVYRMFICIGVIATVITALMVLSQVINIAFLSGSISQLVLRIYVLIFCVLFILAELDIKFILQYIPPLKNWIYRGFLYSFIGVIGVEESFAALAEQYPEVPSIKTRMASMFLKFSSFAMAVLGVLYMVLGVLCLHSVYKKLETKYTNKVDRFTEINQV